MINALKTSWFSVILIVLLPLFSTAQKFSLFTSNAFVNFHFVSKNTKGIIDDINAEIELNIFDLTSSKVKGSAEVEKLKTHGTMRDKHLKSEAYFDVAQFPKMYFESDSIFRENDQLFTIGNLKIKDVIQQVRFVIMERETELVFKSIIFTSDFGIELFKKREKNKVIIEIHLPLN